MEDSGSTKYVIHAQIKANGVVERPDVVGAIFGQTEGLIGKDLDLRDLQKTGRVGRINVEVDSQGGSSTGSLRIPTSLSKLETSVLAASLETIDRIGPCKAEVEVGRIEDVRESKREQIADRAQQLISEHFDESASTGDITSVMEGSAKDEVTKHHGLTAGPNVKDSDAILMVEGRSDVLNLLEYGIKNAVAVGGTDAPEQVGKITKNKTVTAFLDGDRGGELILKELRQKADIDFVARAPDGKQVEHLDRDEVTEALKEKMSPEKAQKEMDEESEAEEEEDSGGKKKKVKRVTSKPKKSLKSNLLKNAKTRINEKLEGDKAEESGADGEPAAEPAEAESPSGQDTEDQPESTCEEVEEVTETERPEPEGTSESEVEELESEGREPKSLDEHYEDLEGTKMARLLNGEGRVLGEVEVGSASEVLKNGHSGVASMVMDGIVTQRLLDVASEEGVENIVGAGMGEVVHRPASTKVEIKGV